MNQKRAGQGHGWPAHLRGTAFGFFSLITGVALLAASVVAGWLWTAFGPCTIFKRARKFHHIAELSAVDAFGRKATPLTTVLTEQLKDRGNVVEA